MTDRPHDPHERRSKDVEPDTDWHRMVAVGVATVITVVMIIVLVENVARQPVLVTSLASSTFLLYYQPLHRMNRFSAVVGGHLIAAGIGFTAGEFVAADVAAPALAITGSVAVLTSLRIVHPPAVSTSVVFAYRPHDVSALLTFLLTLLVVVALATAYFFIRHVLIRTRWAALFGLDDHGS